MTKLNRRDARRVAARPAHPARTRPASPHPSRAGLLAGVSLSALAAAGLFAPQAMAGQPPLFSPQWYATRTQTLRSAAIAGSTVTSNTAASAASKASQSVADLSRAAAALNAAKAFQAGAIAAAAQSAAAAQVPDGLAAGGLQVAPGAAVGSTLWIGANLPSQSVAAGKTTVTVTQTQQKALLNWQSLNVGANTTLAFDQKTNGGANATNWVALNKVNGGTSPSQILGSITAAGKVYLLNPNGIIFGAGSQVNVNALIATSANLATSVTAGANGALPTVDYTIYGAQQDAGFAPSFTDAPAASTIEVKAGAQIATAKPASATAGGGYAMLLGGTARNAGSIVTPGGQAVLAAGQNFVLRPGYSTDGNAVATTRGSQVATQGLAGSAENSGIITATNGDITLVGHRVVQSGVAFATTSVNVRGTVHLLSDTADADASITIAPGSLTTVQPDDSQETALNSQRSALITQSASLDLLRAAGASSTNPQVNNVGTLSDRLDQSRVEIVTGGSVEFATGSLTMAQGGQIAVQAGGRVQASGSAALDVSGQVGVLLPMSANELAVSVQSFEQRDAPVNRLAGKLNSNTVTLDARGLVLVPASAAYPTDRYYTAGGLLEVSGYLNTTGHTIGEWTAVGGSIALSGKEVVAHTGSVFNISGGSLNYQAGTLHNTYLVSASGGLYNVNTAPADIEYAGVYKGEQIDHPRWNVTDTFYNPLIAPRDVAQAGYVVGRDAGRLTLSAPTAIFEGTLVAGVVNGAYQNAARPAGVTDGYTLGQTVVAQPGVLALGSYNATGLVAAFATDVRFARDVPALADSLSIDTAVPAGRAQTAWFSSAALNATGLGGLAVASATRIQVADGITLAPGASAQFVAPTIDVAGGIVARGGTISLGNVLAVASGGSTTRTPLGALAEALVTLEPAATLDTRGLWTNARLDPSIVATEAYVNGGAVVLDSTGPLRLAEGSLIDVSAGGALVGGGKTLSGKGGSVSIIGDDPAFSVGATTVELRGAIRGYGVGGGGTLKLVAPAVAISATQPALSAATVWLGPDFFTQGFATYDVTGLTGVSVADGTVIEAAAPVYRVIDASGSAPTGTDPASAMQLWLPPLYTPNPGSASFNKRQGVSLLLRADANAGTSVARGGPVTLGLGAVIAVDPGQSVRLEGYEQVTVNGTIEAPGGAISVVNMRQENFTAVLPPGFSPGLSVWLGAASRLDAAARAVTATDNAGRSFAAVTDGGTVTLGADGGKRSDGTVLSTDAQVIVRPGAVVDVSGASAVVDPAAGNAGQLAEAVVGGGVATRVSSNGGTISLSSYNGLYIDGTLLAASGGAGALGGTLALTVEAPLYSSNAAVQPGRQDLLPRVILVSQATTSDLGSSVARPGDATPDAARNQARISAAQVAAGGFAHLSLFARDVIAFDGAVALSLAGSVTLLQGIISETDSAAHASVSAPYVSLSGYTSVNSAEGVVAGVSVNGVQWLPNRAATSATLSVSASLIDISNDIRFGVQGAVPVGVAPEGGTQETIPVAYAGFDRIDLSSGGDIRFGSSTLVTPGSLKLTAAQVYPTTQANASVYAGVNYYAGADGNAYTAGRTLAVAWNGVRAAAPYSVGGRLVLAAPTVEQGGVVRAPEGGIVLGAVSNAPVGAPSGDATFAALVHLLPGSITSVSINGQTLPFGGTADNQTYTYNGARVAPFDPSVALDAQAVQADSGATIDLSGGGTLTGAVFQSGRGGSVDTLLSPLQSFASGALVKKSLQTSPVYAIVPGFDSGYAPITPLDQSSKYTGSTPATGLQITLTASINGLPAGTYTLLPSYYALLPGAFRVELGTTARPASVLAGATALPGGSYVVGGYTGSANTEARAALALPATLTPSGVVRAYSQYAETGYSAFQIETAKTTGAPRAAIPADAKTLILVYPSATGSLPALSYAGASKFAPASGGFGSTVLVEGAAGASVLPSFLVTPTGAAPTDGAVSLNAEDLTALRASRLVVGGSAALTSVGGAPTLTFTGQSGSVTIRSGATLSAPEIFLVASSAGGASGAVTMEAGATLTTVVAGAPPYDSDNGYFYNSAGYTVLAASKGRLNFTPDTSSFQFFGAINIADGAELSSAGTLAFSTKQGLTLGAHATYGARYISLDVASVNLLSSAVQAAGDAVTPPSGLLLGQDVLQRLLNGDAALGIPAVTQLTLTATQSVNLFGSVTLDTTAGAGLDQFVLNTPAIYGWSDRSVGGASDVAAINTGGGTLVWNGIATSVAAGPQTLVGSQLPGGFADTGLASGTGTLNISAGQIVLGYPAGAQTQSQVSLDRLVLGFAEVNLTATRQISGNARGSLSVYAQPADVFGQPGSGGNLALNAPALTGSAGAVTRITAGGALSVSGANGAAQSAGGLGAEIDLVGQSIALDSAILLPSGRLTATARTGISLGAAARISVAGASTGFFDQTRDSAAGSVALETAAGDIVQAASGAIDISAGRASAGSLKLTATAGAVSLAGAVQGGAASGQTAGSLEVRAGSLADFAGLNARLTSGGVTGARRFQLRTGSLTVGDELVANVISLALDAGSLTVTGHVNASGAKPGSIDLAARDGLTIAGTALLDAHATTLQVDSHGAAIDALNTPSVTLTSIAGALTLAAGAGIDVRSADAVARGQVSLNAPRVGDDDIAISASGALNIQGVWSGAGQPSGSLAVYGWRSYTQDADAAAGTALVTQAYLDGIDAADTQPFMAAAAANPALQARLAGLKSAAQGAFHLRPGVEIDSGAADGGMTVSGDLNLANYRYAGEPGALTLRASGSLSVNGSVTDGFGAPADNPDNPNPDNNGWVLFSGGDLLGADVVLPMSLPAPISLGAGTTIPTNNAVALNYDITIQASTLNAGVIIPASVTLAPSNDPDVTGYVIPAGGWVATAAITDETGAVVFHAGSVLPAGTVLQAGWTLARGSVLPFQVNVPDGTVWPAGASLRAFNFGTITLLADAALPGGAFIPSGSSVQFSDFSSQQNLRDASSGSQGAIWAIAPMLPAGALSWSIGLVSGADTASASRAAVQAKSQLAGGGGMILSDLHYTAPQAGAFGATPSFSVIRTGQGDLSIASGGDITQYSLWGIYTAGTQSADVEDRFQLPQGASADGTVLGEGNQYNDYVVNYRAYFPTHGGNVSLSAQGGIYGDLYGSSSSINPASDWVGNWLWRQGDGAAQATAWWINFGNYVLPAGNSGQVLSGQAALEGFVGIGTLGGGNLTVTADGDAGVTTGRDPNTRSQGLVLAVASTGRVTGVDSSGGVVTGGTLVETGGGSLKVSIGGALNSLDPGNQNVSYDGLNGTFINLRGDIDVHAGSIGRIVYQYGTIDPVDSRPLDPFNAGVATEQGGLIVVPGDGAVRLETQGDLVLAGAGDAGRLPMQNLPGFSYTAPDGTAGEAASGGQSSFSLWTARTSITLVSTGGNVTPTTQPLFGSLTSVVSNDMPTDTRFVFPATLNVIADSGSIYYGTLAQVGSSMTHSLELAPAATGQVELLAGRSIYATGYSIDISGANADANSLANPFRPLFTGSTLVNFELITVSNAYLGAASPYSLFAFGADTPTSNLHAGDAEPARIYAAEGDIVDFRFGEILNYSASSGITPSTWYIAAKPAWVLAGRDIVAAGTRPALDSGTVGSTVFGNEPNQANSGSPTAFTTGNLILNTGSNDVSLISAGRDILQSYFYIAGPGVLDVTAGRNLNQQNAGILKSLGPLVDIGAQGRSGGASISVLAGAGTAGIDTANFARLYFDAGNQADPDFPLTAAQNKGKVAKTYDAELLSWLKANYGYAGSADGALAFFLALPGQQQDVFARKVYFAELVASGREQGDPTSRRYRSYVRGTEAIYALLPWTPAPVAGADANAASDLAAYASVVPTDIAAAAAAGTGVTYAGSVTMFSGTLNNSSGSPISNTTTGQQMVFDAGISTQFGGDIQVIAPGGQVLLGLSGGVQPGSNTGLVTFGSGNIQTFARGSVVLGQSRVFTTFGGNIQLWSATGDVNAGIGTKTSVVYQPPGLSYDELGSITLAPTAPTNGAGIATLSSVPGVPAGDVDLVAPIGTIDAGEAGIRVSGNLTLAALTVANSANLQVGGKTSGAPTVAVSNVGALSAAAAASSATQNSASNAAEDARRKRAAAEGSIIVVEVLGFGE